MREIKFRIWDKKNKVMMVDWQNFKFIKTIDKYSFLRLGTSGGKWILTIAKLEDYIPMQYTGLKDKNGKEIYEGDIVNWNNKIGYVDFLKQEMGYCIVLKDTDFRLGHFKLGHRNIGSGYDFNAEIEVIGNIHDNPELLEVE